MIDVEKDGRPQVPADLGEEPDEIAEARPSARDMRLSRGPGGVLRLVVGDNRCYLRVKVVKVSPLAFPSRYFAFLDGKGGEICMIDSLEELETSSCGLAREALRRFYVVARIRQVKVLRAEMGMTYWDVETDLGARDFAVKDVNENVRDLGEGRLLVTDVHGNRYEVSDIGKIDRRSRLLIQGIL